MQKSKNIPAMLICGVLGAIMAIILICMVGSYARKAFSIHSSKLDRILGNLTIQTEQIDPYWEERYPHQYTLLQKYQRAILSEEDTISAYCLTSLPNRRVHATVSFYKSSVLHYQEDSINALYQNTSYIAEPATNTGDFANWLQGQNIPFLYVQTPNPDKVRYCQGDEQAFSDYVQRDVALGRALQAMDVPYLDLAADYADSITFAFDQTNHWQPTTALQAAAAVAERLNDLYKAGLPTSCYQDDQYTDYLEEFPDQQQELLDVFGSPYTLPVPITGGCYTLTYAESDITKGTWPQVLLRPASEWRLLNDSAYFGTFQMVNSLIYNIRNEAPYAAPKKILVIGDSFNWALSSYLAVGVQQIDVLHNASFDGSIRTYIQKTNPDYVVVCYNDAEFYSEYTEKAFDFQ